MDDIILIGIGGHAKGIVDLIEDQGRYNIAGFIGRPEESNKKYREYKFIGSDDDLERLYKDDGIKHAFITIGYLGNSQARNRIYEKLKKIGYDLPTFIDKTAAVSDNIKIGEGSFVGRKAVINADAEIGKMCIVNNGAIVEHDCSIGDFSHVAVGAVICGESKIGRDVMIGANATIIQCVSIGNDSVIGAGAIVLDDVGDEKTIAGVWKGDNRHA